MAKRGPRPKPAAIKKLQGSRPDRIKPEPQVENTKPRCPSHLSPAAKAEWRRIAGPLHEAGLLKYVDRAALAGFCSAYGRWVLAEKKIAELGDEGLVVETKHGNHVKSTLLVISDKALSQMLQFSKEFGLTPSSRASLAVTETGPQWSLADELAAAAQRYRNKD